MGPVGHAAAAWSRLTGRARAVDERIASLELPEIPKPDGEVDGTRFTVALQAEVEQLCGQLTLNMREQQRWMVEAECAILEHDDVRAQAALTRHAEHLRLAQEADSLLMEYRRLVIEVRRSLPIDERGTNREQDEDAS